MSQKTIQKIEHHVQKAGHVVLAVFAVAVAVAVVCSLVGMAPYVSAAMRVVLTTLLMLLLVIGAAMLVLSLFSHGDDDEAQVAASLPILPRKPYTPLRNLTEQQQERICDMLRQLPSHGSKPNSINMSIMANHLVALYEKGYLDDTNMKNLRLWVSEITGKDVPPTGQFHEAYQRRNKTKTDHAKQRIEALLAQPC